MMVYSFLWSYPLSFYYFETLLWVALLGIPLGVYLLWFRLPFLQKYQVWFKLLLLIIGFLGWFLVSTIWIFVLAVLLLTTLHLILRAHDVVKISVITLSLCLWFCLGYGSFIESKWLKVEEQTLDLPNEMGLRVAVVADFHLGPYKNEKWVKKVVDRLNALEDIDLILMPGDYVYGDAKIHAKGMRPLKDLKIAPVVTLGNHDHSDHEAENKHQSEQVTKVLNEAGAKILDNQTVFDDKHDVWLIGVDDNDLGYHDLEAAFKHVKGDYPSILLAHSPEIVQDLKEKDLKPNLVLSGHTHCGQIRLPFYGAFPMTIPTPFGKQLDKHFYRVDNQAVFITCGVGEVGPRARFFNRPEIVILNL